MSMWEPPTMRVEVISGARAPREQDVASRAKGTTKICKRESTARNMRTPRSFSRRRLLDHQARGGFFSPGKDGNQRLSKVSTANFPGPNSNTMTDATRKVYGAAA